MSLLIGGDDCVQTLGTFNKFRISSLKPEAYFQEEINKDIKEKECDGFISTWQKDLLSSIQKCYSMANTSYDEVKANKDKFPSISTRFRLTNNQRLYDIAYRVKCHDIHGDWVDFCENYLSYDESAETFSPNFQEYDADVRQLSPILLICCNTLKTFIREYPGHGINQSYCYQIDNDQKTIETLEDLHMKFLKRRKAGVES